MIVERKQSETIDTDNQRSTQIIHLLDQKFSLVIKVSQFVDSMFCVLNVETT